MTPSQIQQLASLGEYLASRREAILLAWRMTARADPAQTTAHSLSRGQLNDHIPQVLDAFERKLCARPGGAAERAADRDKDHEEVQHGLHRWQQGYRLLELTHEWGHLQICLFEELAAFAAAHAEFERETLAEATRQMVTLVNEAISGSVEQYERMAQAEAAGHVNDLRSTLASVNALEQRRAGLIHEAVHDLGNDVLNVTVAATLLGGTDLAEAKRLEFAALLQQGVQAVAVMLNELMELARLEAGQERREISGFNAASVLTGLCDLNRPLARERGLYLKAIGPAELPVDGDPSKVQRLLQNLVRNSLKYTVRGGVTVSWGEEEDNWWLMVKDTGPGILAGPGAPIVVGLKAATVSARESDEKTAETMGEASHVLASPKGDTGATSAAHQQPGEGVGLSIVKRLCELLDASVEMASSPETGTTFRVVFPRDYPPAGSAG